MARKKTDKTVDKTYNKMIIVGTIHPNEQQEALLFQMLNDTQTYRQYLMDFAKAEHDKYLAQALMYAEKTRYFKYKLNVELKKFDAMDFGKTKKGQKTKQKLIDEIWDKYHNNLDYLKTTYFDDAGKLDKRGFNHVGKDQRGSLHSGTAQIIAEEYVINHNVAMDKRIAKYGKGYPNLGAMQKQKHINGQKALKNGTKRSGKGSSYKNQFLPRLADGATAIPFRVSNKGQPDLRINFDAMALILPKFKKSVLRLSMNKHRKADFKAIDPADITKVFVKYDATNNRWLLLICIKDMLVSQKTAYNKVAQSDDADAYDLNTKGENFHKHVGQNVKFTDFIDHERFMEVNEYRLATLQQEYALLAREHKTDTNRYRNVERKINRVHQKVANMRQELAIKCALKAVKNDHGALYAQLGIEDLNINSMHNKNKDTKNKNMGNKKHLNDVPLGALTTWVEATCEKFNYLDKAITLIKVDSFMTSKYISAEVNDGITEFKLDLKNEKTIVTSTGKIINRDANAAQNVFDIAFNNRNIRAEYNAMYQ